MVICLALVIAVALSAVMLNSLVEYKVMSNREKLKAQLKEEYRMRTKELFEHIEVERSWYSLPPSDWTFVVKLSVDAEPKYYKIVDGKFVVSRP